MHEDAFIFNNTNHAQNESIDFLDIRTNAETCMKMLLCNCVYVTHVCLFSNKYV